MQICMHFFHLCSESAKLYSSTEFTEVELILGGCCFKFPGQLGIWAMETGGKIQLPSAITVSVPLSKAAVLNAVIFTKKWKSLKLLD